MMTEDGLPKRQNTYIDIPDVLRLPNFMLDDDERVEEDPHGFSTGYKLVLQSVVCHRGDSLQSGHYIALARVNPKLLTENRRCDPDPPPDYEEDQWVKFDDLCVESRVSYVDDIRQALKDEMPYLLFYQIVPTVEVSASTYSGDAEPPSYKDLGTKADGSSSQGGSPSNSVSATPASYSTNQPSIRLSTELDLTRSIGDEGFYTTSSHDNSRRQSAVFLDPFSNDSLLAVSTTGSHSPPPGPSEESTATRLSRAAARFSRSASKSRTPSQQGDGRISSTIRQLGLLRSSKEPLRDGSASGAQSTSGLSLPETGGAESTAVAGGSAVSVSNSNPPKQKKSKTKTAEKKAKGEESERECTVM